MTKKTTFSSAKRFLRNVSRFVLLVLLTLSFTGFAYAAEKPLILAIQPYLPYNELQKRYGPLADYLSKELDQPVIMKTGKDYQYHIDFIGKGLVDIAFIGPSPYVKLVEAYGPKTILARLQTHGNWFYKGRIVVRSDSQAKGINELKGRSFAFGDPRSTMSSILPRFMLWEKGVNLKDLSSFEFLNSHDNVALGVLAGDYDAGAVKDEVYQKYKNRGLQILASTPPIPEHVFVARDNLPPQLVEAVREALFKLKDTEKGRHILQGLKGSTTEVAPAKDSDYDELRYIMKTVKDISNK